MRRAPPHSFPAPEALPAVRHRVQVRVPVPGGMAEGLPSRQQGFPAWLFLEAASPHFLFSD